MRGHEMRVQKMKFINYLILLYISAWCSGVSAWDKQNPRMPLSEITVANLSLGTTVEQYIKHNPKAAFKPVKKQDVYHHDEWTYKQKEGDITTETVFLADQEGVIYRIEHTRFYFRPLESGAIWQKLYEAYGDPVAKEYDTHLSTYCWHGCVPDTRTYNTYASSANPMLIYEKHPQFFITVHDYDEDLIQQFAEIGKSEELNDGWIRFYLIDGKRQTAVEDKWMTKYRAPAAEDQAIDISPN